MAPAARILSLVSLLWTTNLVVTATSGSTSSSLICTQAELESCSSHIVPYTDFNAALPVVEYCIQPGRGYLPVSQGLCKSWGIGPWTVRPEYAEVTDRGQAYTCSVCNWLRELKADSAAQATWMLKIRGDITYTRHDMDVWGTYLGTRVDRISVQGGNKYVIVMGSYDKVQSLLDAATDNFLAWQPVPPELKISPHLADSRARNASDTSLTEIKVWTLIASHEEERHRDARHESARSSIVKALETRQSDWCMNGGSCSVKSLSTGHYLITHLHEDHTLEVATQIAQLVPEALTIDLNMPIRPLNYEASFISQSGFNSSYTAGNRRYWSTGKLTGKGVVVGVADTGLDYNSCFFYDKDNPIVFSTNSDGDQVYSSTSHRKIRQYYGFADTGEHEESGHGTHVSGSVAGYPVYRASTSNAYKYQGMAYMAKLAFYDIGPGTSQDLEVPYSLDVYVFPKAYSVGARLHTNSWGLKANKYDLLAIAADTYSYNNQDFLVLFAAGNNGYGNFTVVSPSTAKNVLAVGATRNIARPDLAYFSSRGPTSDYRIKPDLCAPGYYVYSANSEVNSEPGQCSIVGMAGTSMATPVTAGNAAILYEYFTSGYYPLGYANPNQKIKPMGALLKAVLINSAQKLTGYNSKLHNKASLPTYPNYDQGFGIVDMHSNMFLAGSGQRMLFVDGEWSSGCSACPSFTATAQKKTYTIIPTKSQPIHITMVYHDYPSALLTGGLINDLDLLAVHRGVKYYPNGRSSADTYNNVEEIIISSPTIGKNITITINATDITYSPQPYAIVVSGYFQKDADLFPDAVPKVTSVASYHNQLLLTGSNLPPSAIVNSTVNITCTTGSTIIHPTIIGYSSVGSYLAVDLDTTACQKFRITVDSDNFLGVTSADMTYGAVNISSRCHAIAADTVCASITACQGRCIVEPDQGTTISLHTILIILGFIVLVSVVLGFIIMRATGRCTGKATRRAGPRVWVSTPGPGPVQPSHPGSAGSGKGQVVYVNHQQQVEWQAQQGHQYRQGGGGGGPQIYYGQVVGPAVVGHQQPEHMISTQRNVLNPSPRRDQVRR